MDHPPKDSLPNLYSLDILHVCVQVYFEHFHQKFPILHQGTFEAHTLGLFLTVYVYQRERVKLAVIAFLSYVRALRHGNSRHPLLR